MFLTAKQRDECAEWLMANASPPVKFLTAERFSGSPGGSAKLSGLWKDVESCRDAKEIFGAQKEDGSWFSGGGWAMKPSYAQKGRPGGYDIESPKYVTAIWILPLLGDMGFSVKDPRVEKACGYIISYPGFELPGPSPACESGGVEELRARLCCRYFQRMAALGKVGCMDGRTRPGFDAIVRAQRDDGGWVSQRCVDKNGWTRSCPFSSYHAALALYSAGDPGFKSSLTRGLGFLVKHLSTKNPDEIRRFFFHGHSIVHELLMLSELKVFLDEKPVMATLDWLKGMYRPDEGHFRNNGKPVSGYSRGKDGMDSRVAKYRLYHLAEDDWLTYFAVRIAANLSG